MCGCVCTDVNLHTLGMICGLMVKDSLCIAARTCLSVCASSQLCVHMHATLSVCTC